MLKRIYDVGITFLFEAREVIRYLIEEGDTYSFESFEIEKDYIENMCRPKHTTQYFGLFPNWPDLNQGGLEKELGINTIAWPDKYGPN
jgi:hypothetical protein